MKRILGILCMLCLGLSTTIDVAAQRVRTTAVFDADTSTRPKAGFYGVGVRSSNAFLIPSTGNNIRLANYSLFTGLSTNYLSKWNGSKLVNGLITDNGSNIRIGTTSSTSKMTVIADDGEMLGGVEVIRTLVNPSLKAPQSSRNIMYISDTDGLHNDKEPAALYGGVIVPSGSTGNFTNTSAGFIGVAGTVGLLGTASGNIALASSFNAMMGNSSSATLTTLYGYRLQSVTGGGFTNLIGLGMPLLNNGTNNTHILTGTTTPPTGNFNIYDATGYNSYFSGKVGVGTATPLSKLHVNVSSVNPNSGLVLVNDSQVISSDGSFSGILKILTSRSTGGTSSLRLSSTRGALNAPTASANGDIVGQILSSGYDGSSLIQSANISFRLNGTISTGVVPQDILFSTGSSVSPVERMRILSNGNVGINSTAPTSKLQVVGLPTYADNAAATSGGLTAGAFYRTSTGVLMVVY